MPRPHALQFRLQPYLLALLRLCTLASPALIASSRIEQCLRTSTEDMDCAERMVVSLSINNDVNSTESLEAMLNEVTDADGTTHQLKHPMRISLAKTAMFNRYPIIYKQDFNSKPIEQAVYQGIGEACVDGALATNPTCGWFRGRNGQTVVDDSQGFCCACSAGSFIGLDETERTRASLTCNLFGSESQSASCLRYSDLWYSAYTIEPAQLFFTIKVYITKVKEGVDTPSHESDYVVEELDLGPQVPGAATADGNVIARLIGDFAAYQQTRSLNNKYLMVPSSPQTHERVAQGNKNWMLVDKHHTSSDGTECNKVGTSFAAFRNQAQRCSKKAQSCLGSQLEDFHQSDQQLRDQGSKGEYFVSNFGSFLGVYDHQDTKYIAYAADYRQASLVTLTLNADSVKFVLHVSTAVIDFVNVLPFPAQSKEGQLEMMFTNTGDISSEYSVVVECSQYMFPVLSKTMSVSAMHSEIVTFNIYSEIELDSKQQCVVKLLGSQMATLDSRTVFFNTSAVKRDRGAQAGTAPENDKSGAIKKNIPDGSGGGASYHAAIVPRTDDAETICQCEYYNVICLLWNKESCVAKIQELVMNLLTIVILICICRNRKAIVKCFNTGAEKDESEDPLSVSEQGHSRRHHHHRKHHRQQQPRQPQHHQHQEPRHQRFNSLSDDDLGRHQHHHQHLEHLKHHHEHQKQHQKQHARDKKRYSSLSDDEVRRPAKIHHKLRHNPASASSSTISFTDIECQA